MGWGCVSHHFGVTVTLTSDLFKYNGVRSTSPTLLEIGIPNLVCGCILGWQSVTLYFWVTDLDLFFLNNCDRSISPTLHYLTFRKTPAKTKFV